MPLISAILLAAIAAAPQVAAAGTPSSPYQLTAEQVRKCGATATDRTRLIAELDARDKDILAEQATMMAQQAELTAGAAKVNTKKAKDVAAFNAKSEAYNKAVPEHQKKVAERNALAAQIDPLADVYNRDCAHKSMNPADIAALPEDQQPMLTAGATTSTVMVPAPPEPPAKRRPRR